ncbi:UDP-N-acetylmuramoylalanine--D-glutamate ligase [Serratia plymuthica]|uniref:UDP-N-acetylmuramoylalanine--D-glutamate ligase n=1 Tax=Serratia plymuthica TaxID=82996 RepID=A0A2X4TVB7_SERPL|nr:UDP-N-acetylmuramoylalanine--D-glutamate ligase [Serratia plymuthica]
MADYQGKKVVIIGLGLTGLSCVDFFMARGVTPRVMDTRISPPGWTSCLKALNGIWVT